MKKHVVLSVNSNPDYLFHTPLTVWAWKKLGWEVITMLDGHGTEFHGLVSDACRKLAVEMRTHLLRQNGPYTFPYRSDTITQMSRLYAACVQKDAYLMTADIDMVPLSNYWNPKPDEITIYGHDLTNYGHYPICYIGMSSSRWIEVMGLVSDDFDALINRDLDSLPQARDPAFRRYWFCDQDLITDRLKAPRYEKTFVHRGRLPNRMARGRVDRGAWTLDHEEFIDCHMLRSIFKYPDYLSKTMSLLEKIWPSHDFSWFAEYAADFARLSKKSFSPS